MAPNLTACDITIQVRDAGEKTTACGWVEIDGKRHNLRVEASATDRGATYFLDGEPRWWNEVPEIDEWFEDLWQEAAADAGYDLDNEVDFDARMRSKEFPNTETMRHAGAHTARRILRTTEGLKATNQHAFIVSLVREINEQRPKVVRRALENNETKEDRS